MSFELSQSPVKNAKIRIKNFRSLEDVEVEIKPLTFLFGPNGSGKSSFLKALRFFYYNHLESKNRYVDYNIDEYTDLGSFKDVVTKNDVRRTISFSIGFNSGEAESKIDNMLKIFSDRKLENLKINRIDENFELNEIEIQIPDQNSEYLEEIKKLQNNNNYTFEISIRDKQVNRKVVDKKNKLIFDSSKERFKEKNTSNIMFHHENMRKYEKAGDKEFVSNIKELLINNRTVISQFITTYSDNYLKKKLLELEDKLKIVQNFNIAFFSIVNDLSFWKKATVKQKKNAYLKYLYFYKLVEHDINNFLTNMVSLLHIKGIRNTPPFFFSFEACDELYNISNKDLLRKHINKNPYLKLINAFLLEKEKKKIKILIENTQKLDILLQDDFKIRGLYENYMYEKKLGKVLEFFGLGKNIEKVKTDRGYELILTSMNGSKINLAESSSGLLQILPIIILTYDKFSARIITIEQPELHLHPKLQAKLVEYFTKVQHNYIIETHSEHMVRKAQVMIAKGELKKEDIAVYYFDNKNGTTKVKKMEMDDRGLFKEDWPDGFFDVSTNLTLELFEALRPKRKE